jgi:glycosyltransferase involved in cell wall biosynthesis
MTQLTRRPIASVVVPAYNEEAGIGRTLDSLIDGSTPGEFDVLVVANACTDRTAEVASRDGVRVLETATPGKVHALRLGDDACATFPRVYLDADVAVTAQDVRLLVAALDEPDVLAAAPAPRWDLDGASWVMCRVHTVHDALMVRSRALAGVGVYALDEAGHARVFPMPDIVSDDEWVHRSFASHERAVVSAAQSVVRPAKTVSAHLRRRIRVRLGNRQLEELGKPAAQGRLRSGTLVALVRRREVGVVDAICYLAVLSIDRVMTRRQHSKGVAWSTDTTSRAVAQ